MILIQNTRFGLPTIIYFHIMLLKDILTDQPLKTDFCTQGIVKRVIIVKTFLPKERYFLFYALIRGNKKVLLVIRIIKNRQTLNDDKDVKYELNLTFVIQY